MDSYHSQWRRLRPLISVHVYIYKLYSLRCPDAISARPADNGITVRCNSQGLICDVNLSSSLSSSSSFYFQLSLSVFNILSQLNSLAFYIYFIYPVVYYLTCSLTSYCLFCSCPVVLVLQPPLSGTRTHLTFATLPLSIPSVSFLKLTASSRPSTLPSSSPKCLTFGHWLTLCTLNIHLSLLTYRLIN